MQGVEAVNHLLSGAEERTVLRTRWRTEGSVIQTAPSATRAAFAIRVNVMFFAGRNGKVAPSTR